MADVLAVLNEPPWWSALPGHRLRDDPYPDELQEAFCDDCGTLCRVPEGRLCDCCWIAELEQDEA